MEAEKKNKGQEGEEKEKKWLIFSKILQSNSWNEHT